jgi:hypothetical protein
MYKYNYVYQITNKETGRMYIGTRSSKDKPKDDLGTKYFSSSSDKDFILEQKEKPDLFEYKILHTFDTRLEALEYEIYLHSFYDVARNPLFYNDSRQTSTGFDRTGVKPWNKGKINIYSEETKKKMSENAKNKVVCKNIKTGKIFKVSKKEFENNPNLVGITYGIQCESNSPRAITIEIYNEKDQLVKIAKGNIGKVCKELGISYNAIRKSFTNNTKIIYKKKPGMNDRFLEKYSKFNGWYAKKV